MLPASFLGHHERVDIPGRVWAHVGQPFQPRDYDVVVVGAGRMGAACAYFLRQLAPALKLLLIEEGGLPNEEGASILAPGIWTALDIPPARLRETQWVRGQLQSAFGDLQFQPRPLIELHPEDGPGRIPAASALEAYPESCALVNLEALPYARLDAQAATYRPGLLALHAAQQAIRHSADLLLNTRAHLTPGGVRLERLTVTNTHQIVTHETHEVKAAQVIVAMGARGPAAIEHELGVHTTHGSAYQQYPRLKTPSQARSPLLRAGGLTLRPQHDAYTVVPAIHHRDPHGYTPRGGKLTGVPTGLRRETLEDLVQLMDALPALATDALEVGRSLSDLPGAWVALPDGKPGGQPTHQPVQDGVHLLLGGPGADVLGPSVAYDLAAQLAGTQERPWH